MRNRKCSLETASRTLPALRFDIAEAAQILRMSRAQLYNRICEGMIRPQKDGARTYITQAELERYVDSCSVALTKREQWSSGVAPAGTKSDSVIAAERLPDLS